MRALVKLLQLVLGCVVLCGVDAKEAYVELMISRLDVDTQLKLMVVIQEVRLRWRWFVQ